MSPDDARRRFEGAVLETILDLHPEHLTISELVLRMSGDRDQSEREPLREAIHDLRGSGLVRHAESIVEPTHAAVRAAELLTWP